MPRRKTTSEFINDAINVHGNIYDYSLIKYKNNITHVNIICKKHGVFQQDPITHLRGSGCRKCYNESLLKPKKFTRDFFITEARKIHGNTYEYGDFYSLKKKAEIICSIHGYFYQRPNNHLRLKQGCPTCSKEKKYIKTEEFIKKASIIHNNKYDYSLVIYREGKFPIDMICKKHGVFKQIASNHLRGSGCPSCDIENRRLDIRRFIHRANNIHGDMYDYSEVDYKNATTKVKIICKKHGNFWQSPNNHVSGSQKCPNCSKESNQSKAEQLISKIINEMNFDYRREATFSDLKNPKTNRHLRYDFYIPELNVVIEYDGKHHYQEVLFVRDDLNAIKFRDKIKTDYAEQNGLKLIRIPYWINIKDILVKELIHE
jgi:very-short-patch-repair endonuclease